MNAVLFTSILTASLLMTRQDISAANGQDDDQPIQAKPLWTYAEEGFLRASLSQDGARIAVAEMGGSVSVFNVMQAEPEFVLRQSEDDGELLPAFAQFCLDGRRLVSSRAHSHSKLWDASTGEFLGRFEEESARPLGAHHLRDEKLLVVSDENDIRRVWHIEERQKVCEIRIDGSIQARLNSDGTHVFVWPALQKRAEGDWEAAAYSINGDKEPVKFLHRDRVYQLKESSDGKRLLTCSADASARLWDVATGEKLCQLDCEGGVIDCHFIDDDKLAVTWERNGTIRIWQIPGSKLVQQYQHGSNINGGLVSKSTAQLISYGENHATKVWPLNEDGPPIVLEHEGEVSGAKLTNDETRLLTWGDDGKVRKWSLPDGELLAVFDQGEPILAVELRADDSRLLTVSTHSVKVWAMQHRGQITKFK